MPIGIGQYIGGCAAIGFALFIAAHSDRGVGGLFFWVPLGFGLVLLLIGWLRRVSSAVERAKYEAAQEEAMSIKRKRHEIKWFRLRTWEKAVTECGGLVATKCLLPKGLVCHSDEVVLLSNRDAKLYESQQVYTTDIEGDFTASSVGYGVGVSRTYYPNDPISGTDSNPLSIGIGRMCSSTSGSFSAMATTRAFQEKQLISTGMLLMTSKRIIFIGDHQNRTVNMEDVVSCYGDEEYMVLSAQTYDKPMIIQAFDALVFQRMANWMLSNGVDVMEVPLIALPREVPANKRLSMAKTYNFK